MGVLAFLRYYSMKEKLSVTGSMYRIAMHLKAAVGGGFRRCQSMREKISSPVSCIVQNDVKKEKIQDELSKMSKLQKI